MLKKQSRPPLRPMAAASEQALALGDRGVPPISTERFGAGGSPLPLPSETLGSRSQRQPGRNDATDDGRSAGHSRSTSDQHDGAPGLDQGRGCRAGPSEAFVDSPKMALQAYDVLLELGGGGGVHAHSLGRDTCWWVG